MEVKIVFDEKLNKSIAYYNDIKVGECNLIKENDVWNIIHTEVNELYRGLGIAHKLVDIVIENARKNNKKLIATCSYAKKIININDKQILRKEYLSIRKNIKHKKEKSHLIFEKIIKDEDYINSKVIALYKNLESEVSTDELIDYSLDNKKVVLLPKACENGLDFYKITKDEKLFKSDFGVKEPLENSNNKLDKNKIDLIIIPGICFDVSKNRLGFGKGYYDKYLENTNIKSIALAFEEQIIKNKVLPISKYDVKVNKIITEENMY